MSWRLPQSNAALLIVDVQEKLLAVMPEPQRLENRIVAAAHIARLLQIPIFITEQVPQKLGPTVASIKEAAGDAAQLFHKTTFSAFSVLPAKLPKYVIVCGLETHVCVRQTIYDLRGREHIPYLLADAVASRHLIDHEVALRELATDQILITTLEALSYELLGSAEHSAFKAIQDHIKRLI
ncbi:MAG: isochorismatase family protein [Methylacidiphilales bacterium]|nr:isochorismatase family protein [Candidatus Methylacidiphilales bacterium]MDW8349861.1 isochorismatase family protein [Verrucomicrobiae bacterium]